MNNLRNNPLSEKSINFAIKIVNLYKFLKEDKKEFVLSKQLVRSGTSIGANIFEANRGFSKEDFHYKLSISLKEASETKYWLYLLLKTDYINYSQFKDMINDLQEIIKMLMASCKTLENNKQK